MFTKELSTLHCKKPFTQRLYRYEKKQALFLADIITSINKISQFIGDETYEVFSLDEKTASSVIREIEVIGEAVKQIPEDILSQAPTVPWSLMAKMRDKLIHWYFGIDKEIIWKVATERLPQLLEAIELLYTTIVNQENDNC